MQRRSKLDAIENVAQKLEDEDDELVLEELLTQLKSQFSAELDNFVAQKESLAATKEVVQNLQTRAEDPENYNDFEAEIDELRQDRSLTAQVRQSVTRAWNHAKVEERDEARKFLVEAHTRVAERESELEFATDNIDKQLGLLNDALEAAEDEDVEEIQRLLGEIRDEVLRH